MNFIWISSEPLGALDEFRDRFGLDILPNHILASDTLLLGISSSGAFAYRYWVDHYMNGKLVNSWCGGVDGNCLPEVIVQ